MLTRREALLGMAAVPVAAAIPSAVGPVAADAATPLLAWAHDVSSGDYRTTVIARTAEEAHRLMIEEHYDSDLADDCPRRIHGSTDECQSAECGCDFGVSCVEREPALDTAAARGSIELEDYHAAGWGYVCDRCGGEASGWDWQPVGGFPVCDYCMTVDDWQVVNPERAAELREGRNGACVKSLPRPLCEKAVDS